MDEPNATPSLETPLAQLHRSAQTNLSTWFGCLLPSDFGDWLREYSFVKDSVALLDKNYRAYFTFTGPDRTRYLNAVLTNNIKDLAPDHGALSLLLHPQGRILAEIETFSLAGTLFCVSYAMIRQRLAETFEKFIIMDDTSFTDDTDRYGTLALEGPQAAAAIRDLAQIDLAGLDELESANAQIQNIPCRVAKRSPGRIPGAEIVADRQHLPALWQILSDSARAHQGGPMGYTALNALRLEQGIPWFSYDFGEKQIPHEADLQDSHISYTKGCYTGQEIVERVRSRGQVNRRRIHLIFTGTEVPAPGESLRDAEGKEAGFITRATFSPALRAPIAMAYVRKENQSLGATLHTTNATATVTHFPEALAAAAEQSA
ncbi:MAG TPA: glycine cleavage T C-terminal barrel domain-containing protein [Candidatus Acidoferrum sp.]|jgi:folate-binding protein YgfZ